MPPGASTQADSLASDAPEVYATAGRRSGRWKGLQWPPEGSHSRI